MNNRADMGDYRTAPIRTYRECVEILRARGEDWLSTSTASFYEKSAFKKLKPLLEAEAKDRE